jgi:hypothetical protein
VAELSFKVEIPYEDGAREKIMAALDKALLEHGEVQDVQKSWVDNMLMFGGKVKNVRISGSLVLEPGVATVVLQVPLFVKWAFSEKIERGLHEAVVQVFGTSA